MGFGLRALGLGPLGLRASGLGFIGENFERVASLQTLLLESPIDTPHKPETPICFLHVLRLEDSVGRRCRAWFRNRASVSGFGIMCIDPVYELFVG